MTQVPAFSLYPVLQVVQVKTLLAKAKTEQKVEK